MKIFEQRRPDPYKYPHLNRDKKDEAFYEFFSNAIIVSMVGGILLFSIIAALLWGNGPLCNAIAIIVIPVGLFLTWWVIPGLSIRLQNYLVHKKVYKVEGAHTLFDVEPVTDISVTDTWYRNGALKVVLGDRELDLFYNWLLDAGVIKDGRVTLYSLPKEDFLKKYDYVDEKLVGLEDTSILYILPLDETLMKGRKAEVYQRLTVTHIYGLSCCRWFSGYVNGAHTVYRKGTVFEYKDIVEGFEEI